MGRWVVAQGWGWTFGKRCAETERDRNHTRGRDTWRQSQRNSSGAERQSRDCQGGDSSKPGLGSSSLRTSGGPSRQEEAETIEQLPGDRGRGLPAWGPLRDQPWLHSAFPGLSQAHKSLGTGETCVQTRKRQLAGGMMRGLGERKDRQGADKTDQR